MLTLDWPQRLKAPPGLRLVLANPQRAANTLLIILVLYVTLYLLWISRHGYVIPGHWATHAIYVYEPRPADAAEGQSKQLAGERWRRLSEFDLSAFHGVPAKHGDKNDDNETVIQEEHEQLTSDDTSGIADTSKPSVSNDKEAAADPATRNDDDDRPDRIKLPRPLTPSEIDSTLVAHAINGTVFLVILNDAQIPYLKNLLCSVAHINEDIISSFVIQPLTPNAYRSLAIMRYFHRRIKRLDPHSNGRLRTWGSGARELAILPPMVLPNVPYVDDARYVPIDEHFLELSLHRYAALGHILSASLSTNIVLLDADTVMVKDITRTFTDVVDGGRADIMYSPVTHRLWIDKKTPVDPYQGNMFPLPASTAVLYLAATQNARYFISQVVELMRGGKSDREAVGDILGQMNGAAPLYQLVGRLPRGLQPTEANVEMPADFVAKFVLRGVSDHSKTGVRVLDPIEFPGAVMYEFSVEGYAQNFERKFGTTIKMLHGDFSTGRSGKMTRFKRHGWWLVDEYDSCYRVQSWLRGSSLSPQELDSLNGEDGRRLWWRPGEIPRNIDSGFSNYDKPPDDKPKEGQIIVVA